MGQFRSFMRRYMYACLDIWTNMKSVIRMYALSTTSISLKQIVKAVYWTLLRSRKWKAWTCSTRHYLQHDGESPGHRAIRHAFRLHESCGTTHQVKPSASEPKLSEIKTSVKIYTWRSISQQWFPFKKPFAVNAAATMLLRTSKSSGTRQSKQCQHANPCHLFIKKQVALNNCDSCSLWLN